MAGFLNDVVVADFNNDGVPDLVLCLIDSNLDTSSFSIDLLLGNGDGTFRMSPIVPAGQAQSIPLLIAAGDFNRDGNMDIAVAGGGPVKSGTAQLQVFLGNGQGSFQTGTSVSFPSGFSTLTGTLADANGDGIPDIILALKSDKQEEVAVFLGNGGGTFTQLPVQPLTLAVDGMIAGHFRGTTAVDLLEVNVVNEGTELTICAGNGDGTFQAGVPVAFPSGLRPWPFGLVAGDWNADGITDLAMAALPAGFLGSAISAPANSLEAEIQVLQGLPAGDLVVIMNGITPSPALAVSKTQLQFAYVAGGTASLAQSVAISNSGTGTLNWSASSDSSWLAVSPASGSGAANLSISISPAGLTPATYTGHIKISASGAASSPQTVTVTLAISAPSTAPVVTAVVNGASFQPGIESGSWVTILGSNLSNTSPGRTWTASEIVNGNLPQALDGASVTIDGKPAYVYYISPTQLNVQAPTDSATGNVAVVVTNNSQTSASFNAQLETASPAFFLYPGTSDPIASHFPDYGLVGTSSAPAHPGDVLILWATGFGLTNPPTPAGIVITGAPATATLPVITIGGAQVPVSAAVLAPGSAGLYQIAIQLPSTVPTGSVAIQASVGGAMSPTGTTIVVQ